MSEEIVNFYEAIMGSRYKHCNVSTRLFTTVAVILGIKDFPTHNPYFISSARARGLDVSRFLVRGGETILHLDDEDIRFLNRSLVFHGMLMRCEQRDIPVVDVIQL